MPTPYQVTCNECAATLTIARRMMDNDGDVCVEVDPCEACIEQAVEEAVGKLEGES